MTYCVGLRLEQGLIFVSDSRTNAGIDHIATFRKLHRFGIPGERLLVLQTAGNLATSQAVVSTLFHAIQADQGRHLNNVSSLFEAAGLVGQTMREVMSRTSTLARGDEYDFSSSILLGGQIKGQQVCIARVIQTPYPPLLELYDVRRPGCGVLGSPAQ